MGSGTAPHRGPSPPTLAVRFVRASDAEDACAVITSHSASLRRYDGGETGEGWLLRQQPGLSSDIRILFFKTTVTLIPTVQEIPPLAPLTG